MDGVLEFGRHGLGKRDDQVPTKRGGNAGEGIDAIAAAPAFLQAGDDRLRRPHALCELPLAEADLGTQVIDHLREAEVLLAASATTCVRARSISARSLSRCLRNVVSNTLRPSLVNR